MKFATDRRRARTFMCTRHVGGPLDAMGDGWNGPLNKVDAFRYEIPRSYKPAMRTNGLVFIDELMVPQLRQDQAPEQVANRSEEHTSELQSQSNLVCRLLLEKKNNQ